MASSIGTVGPERSLPRPRAVRRPRDVSARARSCSGLGVPDTRFVVVTTKAGASALRRDGWADFAEIQGPADRRGSASPSADGGAGVAPLARAAAELRRSAQPGERRAGLDPGHALGDHAATITFLRQVTPRDDSRLSADGRAGGEESRCLAYRLGRGARRDLFAPRPRPGRLPVVPTVRAGRPTRPQTKNACEWSMPWRPAPRALRRRQAAAQEPAPRSSFTVATRGRRRRAGRASGDLRRGAPVAAELGVAERSGSSTSCPTPSSRHSGASRPALRSRRSARASGSPSSRPRPAASPSPARTSRPAGGRA